MYHFILFQNSELQISLKRKVKIDHSSRYQLYSIINTDPLYIHICGFSVMLPTRTPIILYRTGPPLEGKLFCTLLKQAKANVSATFEVYIFLFQMRCKTRQDQWFT